MSDDVPIPVTAARSGVWDALRDPAFTGLWSAGAIALCVVWMQDIGAQWLMKDLSAGDALRVSLVQTFGLLPVVLFALPAGALSDLAGHRRLLIGALVWTAAWSLLLAIGTSREAIGVNLLLMVVLALGVGKAVILPSFAAACAEVASPARLESAVGLHSLANNAGRVVGPMLAGAAIAMLGMAPLFGIALLVMLGATALLVRTVPAGAAPRASSASSGRDGRYLQAVVDGLAYATRTRAIRNVLLRSFGYFFSAVAVHALLPLLSTRPQWFGMGWAAYGIGAIVGALGFSALSRSLSPPRQLAMAIIVHAAMLCALAVVPTDHARTACLFVLGLCWYLIVSCTQLALQRMLPDSMRGRGLSLFAMTLSGAFMIGAPLWGWLATSLGATGGLLAAATFSAAFLGLTFRLPIQGDQ